MRCAPTEVLAEDNGIASLKKKYQGSIDKDGNYHEGASTLISRAKSETQVYKRKGSPIINEDGSLSYKTVKEEYVDKNGNSVSEAMMPLNERLLHHNHRQRI